MEKHTYTIFTHLKGDDDHSFSRQLKQYVSPKWAVKKFMKAFDNDKYDFAILINEERTSKLAMYDTNLKEKYKEYVEYVQSLAM